MTTLERVKPFIFLVLFSGVICAILIIIGRIFPEIILRGTVAPLITGFTLTSLITLTLFFAGIKKGPEKSVMLTLIALGVKMLLSFLLALVFFICLKNRELASVILFFVLYLMFTFYVVFTILNILKKSELKEKTL